MSRRHLLPLELAVSGRPLSARWIPSMPISSLRPYGGGRSWVYFYRWHGKQRRLTRSWPALSWGSPRGMARGAQAF
jgi:hypothetical protein